MSAAALRPDLRLVPAALAAWGVAWQVRVAPPVWVVVLALLLGLLGGLLLLRPRGRTAAAAAAALLCAAAAGTCTAARVAARSAEPLPALVAQQAAVDVRAVVTDDPRRAATRSGGRELVVAEVRVEEIAARGRTWRLRAPVVVLSDARSWLDLLPGQRVGVHGRLRTPRRGDDVAAVLSARSPPRLLDRPDAVQRTAGRLRDGLREAVSVLPEAERGLLPGLVVGDTGLLDEDLRQDFRTTGLSHLVAVSGTNCAIVVGAVLLLSRRVGLPLPARPLVAGLALVGFVVLARPSPSVLRAAVMGAVGLLALATGTRRQAVPALAASVLGLVLLDPDLAAAPGFALSVLATSGLLLLAPGWRTALSRHLPDGLAAAVAVPAAAQAACGPVVVALSGTVGLLSVPANLLAVPAVAPATVLGVLCALLAPVSLPLAQAVAWLAWLPVAWLVLVARVGARVPGAQLPWPDGGRGALLLAGATVLAVVLLGRPALRRVLAAGAAGVLLAVVALLAVRPGWPPPGWFLVACDVGQGDAVVLRAGNGVAVVVDVGPDARLVDGCLRRLDVDRVPLVLLTHLHADHVDGLPGVLRGRQVGAVEVGPLADPPERWAAVREQARTQRVPVVAARPGAVRRLGQLQWEVLAPTQAYRGTRSDPNNSSVVLRLQVGPARVLLTGDVEPEAQADLLTSVADLRADALKVPHHGSRHQEPAFLDAVRARVALTSVGSGNGYGHPSPEVLARLTSAGAVSYRTDLDGDSALVLRDGRLHTAARRGSGTLPRPSMGPTDPVDRAVGALPDHPPPPSPGPAQATGRRPARDTDRAAGVLLDPPEQRARAPPGASGRGRRLRTATRLLVAADLVPPSSLLHPALRAWDDGACPHLPPP